MCKKVCLEFDRQGIVAEEVPIVASRTSDRARIRWRRAAILTLVAMAESMQVVRAQAWDSGQVLVAKSIAALGIRSELRKLDSMKMSIQYADFDTVENDHSGAPDYATFGSVTVTDDFPFVRFPGARLLAPDPT